MPRRYASDIGVPRENVCVGQPNPEVRQENVEDGEEDMDVSQRNVDVLFQNTDAWQRNVGALLQNMDVSVLDTSAASCGRRFFRPLRRAWRVV